MDVGFSEDQEVFRDVVKRFLEDKSTSSDVRRVMATDTGYDPAVWRQACGELGLAGIHLPEAYGGAGFTLVELCIVAEEMGRHLFCGPFFSSAVMAGLAINNEATEDQKSLLLPGIASGDVLASLVLDDLNDVGRCGHSIVAKRAKDKTVELSGTAPMVIDGSVADQFVVAAAEGSVVSLYHLPRASAGVSTVALETADQTRKLTRVTFEGAVAERLGDKPGADMVHLWDQLNTVLANEMVGGAARLFSTTLDYMKLRVQFGRTIGSFQALKHRCADLLMELELARAVAYEAARTVDSAGDTPGSSAGSANTAKAMVSDASVAIAKAAIQLRGGIGFTWEEDTHLWFKRAKSSEVLLGTSHWHREQFIARLEASHV